MRHAKWLPGMLLLCAAAVPALGEEDGDEGTGVKVMPISLATQLDGGQVVAGNWESQDVDGTYLQRTSVWITLELAIGTRLDVHAGVGGLFWYAIPGPNPGGFSEAAIFAGSPMFGPGITRSDMVYRFADEDPMFTLQAGFFPYKYNPDAMNLGEYLLRSGAYPGYVNTGGWNILSEAGYMMQGFRLNMALLDGKFQSEFLLPMERDLPPNGDFSPAYIGTLKPGGGVEFGGGVSCHHCIAMRPSKTSPKVKWNKSRENFGYGSGYVVENPAYDASQPGTDVLGANPRYVYDTTQFYTMQGVKLMARASVDPKAAIPMDFLGPADLKIFAEWAWLGVKNYPFYYEKPAERMPIMFGINLPTFRLLDLATVQVEHYTSRFSNSVGNVYRFRMPTAEFTDSTGKIVDDPNLYDPNARAVTKDDWKWSFYAKKQVFRGMRLYLQAANDHLRVPDFTGKNSNTPITSLPSDWYYLVRIEMGI